MGTDQIRQRGVAVAESRMDCGNRIKQNGKWWPNGFDWSTIGHPKIFSGQSPRLIHPTERYRTSAATASHNRSAALLGGAIDSIPPHRSISLASAPFSGHASCFAAPPLSPVAQTSHTRPSIVVDNLAAPTMAMQFRVRHRANFGDRVVLLGSTPAMGKWDLSRAVPCAWTSGDVWVASDVPRPLAHAPSRFEFKFVVIHPQGEPTWEPGPNHVACIPVHPALPLTFSVDWASPANLTVPAHPDLSPLNGEIEEDELCATSPPPTPAGKGDALRGDGDVNPLAIAVARVAAHVGNGDVAAEEAEGVPVKFRIKYRPEEGETVYMLGSIPELGAWNKMHSPLMSPAGDGDGLYEVAMKLPRDAEHEQFEYKYFTRRGDGSRRWEEGENRVARPFDKGAPRDRDADGVVLWDDRWEKIRIEFSIYYPTKECQVMHVTGDPPHIGAWFKPGPTRMELGPVQVLETDVKGRKWFLNVWTDPTLEPFSYRYIVVDEKTKQELWEREPNRRAEFDIEEPVVNSVRILRDVNFVSDMSFDHVPPNLFIGPYPQTAADVDAMAEGGVTGVFNVQTDEDFKHRAIQWDVLMERYNALEITVVRYPIRDFDRDSLRQHLNGATHALDKMLKAGKKVYIHCTAGMGRAPAIAVAWLCWVKEMELDDAVAFVKKHRKVAVPNVPVLEQVLKDPY